VGTAPQFSFLNLGALAPRQLGRGRAAREVGLRLRARVRGCGWPPRGRRARPLSVHHRVAPLCTASCCPCALGILAYIGGGEALSQVQLGDTMLLKEAGSVGFLLWRSVYLVKQVAVRNRVLVSFDWLKASLFGRDITRF
jgi:hypothetical protein